MGQRLGVAALRRQTLANVHLASRMKIFPPVRQGHHEQQKQGRETHLQPLRVIPIFDERSARRTESKVSNLYGIGRASNVSVTARADRLVDEWHVREKQPSLFCLSRSLLHARLAVRRAIQVKQGSDREGLATLTASSFAHWRRLCIGMSCYGRALTIRNRRQTDPRFLEFITAFHCGEGFLWVASFLNHLARGEVKIGNVQSQFFRFEISTIAKNDDSQSVALGEAFDHRAKAHRASCVPHSLVLLMRIEEPAEAVGNGLAGMQIVV